MESLSIYWESKRNKYAGIVEKQVKLKQGFPDQWGLVMLELAGNRRKDF